MGGGGGGGGGGAGPQSLQHVKQIQVPTHSHHLYLYLVKAFLFGIILGQLLIILYAAPTQLYCLHTAETLVSICPHNVQLTQST